MSQEIIIDPWTWLDHKPSFQGRGRGKFLAPSWVGEHHRRLMAYRMLDSYYMNSAREWMFDMEEDAKQSRREYGDAQTVVNQIVTSLLGIDQSIVVGGDETEQSSAAAKKVRDGLQEWATQENFFLKLLESERNDVRLGDSVYVLGWDPDANRPRVTVWDPGFYFPVLDPTEVTDNYPDKVHIAYEYEDTDTRGDSRRYVRRITWELIEVENGYDLPWNEGITTSTCVMSDVHWLIDTMKGEVDDFTMEKAIFADYVDPDTGEVYPFDRIDLGIDFIPVVHVPNTPSGAHHFGQSSIAPVVQVLDDLISTDTDLQASSATTGSPPIALTGASAPKNDDGTISSYGPGTVFETGDGTATMIDTSRSLDALLKYDDHLLERLSVNGRVPESLLGRVKPNEVPSGIALTLSFAPHSSMIQEMRMVRNIKYRLLFKFIVRMYRLWGDDDAWNTDKEFAIVLKFGTFLPADRKETVDLVVQLLSAKAISVETAVRMLVEAGFPIEDAAKEVQRIIESDYESAGALVDATGDVDAARDRLGLPAREAAPLGGGTQPPGLPEPGNPALDQLPQPGQPTPQPQPFTQ